MSTNTTSAATTSRGDETARRPRIIQQTGPTGMQSFLLAALRIGVGWHFLYEGWVKLTDATWSAGPVLESSTSVAAGFFHWLAADPVRLMVTDYLNIFGLLIIGLFLVLGLFTRWVALAGVVLMALYYMLFPPFFGDMPAGAPLEGSYLLVNKNLLELLALLVVAACPANEWGLAGLVAFLRSGPRQDAAGSASGERPVVPSDYKLGGAASAEGSVSRRVILTSLLGLPVLGGFVWALLKRHGYQSFEEICLVRQPQPCCDPEEVAAAEVDAVSQATRVYDWSRLEDLEERMPTAKIKNVELSRMILGGNLIGGWAHARDLIYVSKLVKAYHHRDKVFETFRIAEACGVNTILTNPILCDVISAYWNEGNGNIQFISDCGGQDVVAAVKKSIDQGACACYVQGAAADRLVEQGKFDVIEQALTLVRDAGLPAGIGAHRLETIKGCVDKGFDPDFWMKTLHKTSYWSARPDETKEHDNIWCRQPEETVAYMNDLPQPWIAFKVLAAGALKPQDAFKYAFQSGADFICVGMYDFQIVDDVNLAVRALKGDLERTRPWRA